MGWTVAYKEEKTENIEKNNESIAKRLSNLKEICWLK